MRSHTDSGEKVLSEREIRLMVNEKHNQPVIRQAIKTTVVDDIEVETAAIFIEELGFGQDRQRTPPIITGKSYNRED